MPWKETTTMEQKIEFICEWRTGKYTITELCKNFEISRPTAYKLINRFENQGTKAYGNSQDFHKPNIAFFSVFILQKSLLKPVSINFSIALCL